MTPCYNLCKELNCSHWNGQLDCDRLPDSCEYVIEHLVSDRENQDLDGNEYGLWRFFHKDGQVGCEGFFVNGRMEGVWCWWDVNGKLRSECKYVNNKLDGLWKQWDKDGNLQEDFYVDGIKQ